MLITICHATAMAAHQKFLVVGDSFIRRLQSHQIRFHGTTLSICSRAVDIQGYSGKGVHDVRLYLQNMSQSVYSICLSVGCNDLCHASRGAMLDNECETTDLRRIAFDTSSA